MTAIDFIGESNSYGSESASPFCIVELVSGSVQIVNK
jgi:hypothetical protein